MLIGTSLVTTLLGLVGTLLGLSILVQVIQECWKYVASTKADAYQRALFAFLGSRARTLLQPGVTPDLQVDGPFQLLRRRPRGRLLPMDQPTLIAALERIDPDSVRRVLQALRTESDLQNKTPAKPSPAFADVVAQLNATEADSPEYPFVRELLEFLKAWEVTLQPSGQLATVTEQPVDADRLIIAFRQRFLAHTLDVERNFAQLETNFEYIYRRRNTALTFLFGVVVVLLLDMPIATIYRTAKSMTSEQAIALAEAARGAYDSLVAVQASDTGAERQEDSVRAGRYRQISDSVLASLTKAGAAGLPDSTEEKGYLAVRMGQLWNQLFVDKTGKALAYLAECLVTALLISFGAPFWNDVAGALLRVSKGPAEPAPAKPAQDS